MNQAIFSLIHNLSGKNPFLDVTGVFFARYLPYFLVLGALWLIVREPNWRRRIFLFCEIALATIISRGIVTEVVRFFYYSPRPFEAFGFAPLIPESGASLPSGHAAFYFALAMVIFFYNKKWGSWYLGLALLNGIARIFVGVHWPLDVLAGAVLGIGIASGVHWFLRNYRMSLFTLQRETS